MPRSNVHPVIWLLQGEKIGDNAQTKRVADGLQLPYISKYLVFKAPYNHKKPFFRPSVAYIDPICSDTLSTPWPDVIISTGRRLSMVALWIQKQTGHATKIILVGRPRRFKKRFALMITPVHYSGPPDARILPIRFPLMPIDQQRIAQAVLDWQARLAHLPRPLTAVFIGGQTKPFRLDAQVTVELLHQIKQVAREGAVYISTSRRTPAAVVATLKAQLPTNATLFCWSPEVADNPYQALLGTADRFIVTGDSLSMIMEVVQWGKPLAIFALPYQSSWLACLRRGLATRRWWTVPIAKLLYLLQRIGLLGYFRDLTRLHQVLYQEKRAVPLGCPFLPAHSVSLPDELPDVADCIKQRIQ